MYAFKIIGMLIAISFAQHLNKPYRESLALIDITVTQRHENSAGRFVPHHLPFSSHCEA